jgi:hypothetical protein
VLAKEKEHGGVGLNVIQLWKVMKWATLEPAREYVHGAETDAKMWELG